MTNMTNNLIAEYVLESEKNVRLAAKVLEAFDDIVEVLVKGFLNELKIELAKSLGNKWVIHNDLGDDVAGKVDFWFGKEEWQDNYGIGFAPDNAGLRNIYFFVRRYEDVVTSPIKEVNTSLSERYRKGNTFKSYDWWQYAENGYRNWKNEDILVQLYHKKEMIEYFKNHLLIIKDIVTPIIDTEMKKYLLKEVN